MTNNTPGRFTGDVANSQPGGGHVVALLRHFVDLRDGTHAGQVRRVDKEAAFVESVTILDPYARQVLDEINETLLLTTGTVEATGVQPVRDGGLAARWTLRWPRQIREGLAPITLNAHFGSTFHHPHLGGATVGEWPLNVFTTNDARDMVPIMRAIVTADLHNLVYQRDYRIVPAITDPPGAGELPAGDA